MIYTFLTPQHEVFWTEGSHTARVIDRIFDREVDVFTFGWEKNSPDIVDFTEALASWVNYTYTVEDMNV